MNLLLAIAIYYVVLIAHGFKAQVTLLSNPNHHFVGASQTIGVLITDIAPGSPAQESNLHKQDMIISVDQQPIKSYESFTNYVDQHKGQAISLVVLNDQYQERTVLVTPRTVVPKGQGPLGVEFEGGIAFAVLSYNTIPQKIFSGISQTYNVGVYSFEVFGQLIGSAFQHHTVAPVSNNISGPVGIAGIVSDLLSLGGWKAVLALLEFMALLSLNLAVVNVLPFPALDGGRLLFLVIEGVTRKRIAPNVERVVNTAGMALLLGLILLVTFNDLIKLFQK